MEKKTVLSSEQQEPIAYDHSLSKTPAQKNPFCRRTELDRRSDNERRESVDSTKYSVERRSSVVDRRKGQDRRRHDYWNSNYRYWNPGV